MRVLVLAREDTDGLRAAIESTAVFLACRGICVRTVPSCEDALAAAEEWPPDVVMVGPEYTVQERVGAVAQLTCAAPRAAIAALARDDEADTERALIEAGAQDVLVWPLPEPRDVAGRLRRACIRQQSVAKLRLDALTDEQTGLLNRRGFVSQAGGMHRLAERMASALLVAVLDVDNLKAVNDRLGHACGDMLLADVAHVLRTCLRGSDTLGRLGGDEFGFAAFGAPAEHGAGVVSRIRTALTEHCAQRGRPYTPSVSVGWTVYAPGSGMDVEDLLERADRLMYADKASRAKSGIVT